MFLFNTRVIISLTRLTHCLLVSLLSALTLVALPKADIPISMERIYACIPLQFLCELHNNCAEQNYSALIRVHHPPLKPQNREFRRPPPAHRSNNSRFLGLWAAVKL